MTYLTFLFMSYLKIILYQLTCMICRTSVTTYVATDENKIQPSKTQPHFILKCSCKVDPSLYFNMFWLKTLSPA